MSMQITELVRYRNHLPPHLVKIADWLIHRHFCHVPVLSEFLSNPPPQDPIGRRPKKIFKLECWLEVIRIKLIDELERRERNAPYMGGVYRKGVH